MSQEHRRMNSKQKAEELSRIEWETESKLLTRPLLLIIFVLCIVMYRLTLNPFLGGGDSSEFPTIAYSLGIAHPPGYPLYTLLAKVFTWIPLGSIAGRVNFLSAVLDTGAALLLFLAVNRWSRNIWAGVLSAGLFAFSPLTWSYAIVSEVFALNNLFVAAFLYLAVLGATSPRISDRHIYWVSFLLGLGLTHHHTLVFVGVPILFWLVLLRQRDRNNGLFFHKCLPKCLGLFFIGLLPYLYLPISASRKLIHSWGNAGTLDGFFKILFRSDYGTFKLAGTEESGTMDFLTLNFQFFKNLAEQFLYFGIVLGALGLFVTSKREKQKNLALVTAGIFILYIVSFHSLANMPLGNLEIVARFWQLPQIIFAAWIGLGFAFLAQKTKKQFSFLVPFSAGVLLSLQIYLHYKSVDQSTNSTFERFGTAILNSLPQNTILFSRGDLYSGTVQYLQTCENHRQDVRFIDRELLTQPWMKALVEANYPDVKLPGRVYHPFFPEGYNLLTLIDANFTQHPIAFTELYSTEDTTWQEKYEIWPYEFLYIAKIKTSDFSIEDYLKESDSLFSQFDFSDLKNARPGSWESYVYFEFWKAQFRRVQTVLGYVEKHQDKLNTLKLLGNSLSLFIEKQQPNPRPELVKALGLIYSRIIPINPEYKEKMKNAWQGYLRNPLPEDRDIGKIEALIK